MTEVPIIENPIPAKIFFSCVYGIGKSCFVECFLFHVVMEDIIHKSLS